MTLNTKELEQTVSAVLGGNKGILACDESPGTMAKRFGDKMENTPENRAGIRSCFFSTKGLNQTIGGVILHDETIRDEKTIKHLKDQKIVLGIKTDLGLADLEGGNKGEQTTKGLDDLLERSQNYYKLGGRFAKWRSVCKIIDGQETSKASYEDVSDVLAEYAKKSQAAGLVPIIEPEVMQDGNHDIAMSLKVTKEIIKKTLDKCVVVNDKDKLPAVHMPGAILKVNMVTKGAQTAGEHNPREVAEKTVEALVYGIGNHKIGGVAFLSGGLSEKDSAEFLNLINTVKNERKVLKNIPLHFSFARALQKTAISLYTEGKKDEAQLALIHRCKMCSMATKGEYKKELEGEYESKAGASNFVANNAY